MTKKSIYMDYAAATPIDRRVLRAMKPFLSTRFFNPSALYKPARKVADAVSDARKRVAKILGARISEVIFTAGGTEANNLAISGVMRKFPGANMLISAIEHESVFETAKQFNFSEINVGSDGIVDLDDLAKKISNKTVLISVIYANNEIGTIQPIKKVASIVSQVRRQRQKQGNKLPLYLHTDAAQAGNFLGLHTSRLGVDLMTLNSGKIYGPKQCGALFVKAKTVLSPIIFGGGQEMNYRSGSENTANIIGFAKALEIAQKNYTRKARQMNSLQQFFIKRLQSKIPTATLNGSLKSRLPNNLHITLNGQDNERLLILLDENNIYVASGSACSASKEEPSRVLKAIGLSDEDARSSLRFSMGRETTKRQIKKVVEALAKSLQ